MFHLTEQAFCTAWKQPVFWDFRPLLLQRQAEQHLSLWYLAYRLQRNELLWRWYRPDFGTDCDTWYVSCM